MGLRNRGTCLCESYNFKHWQDSVSPEQNPALWWKINMRLWRIQWSPPHFISRAGFMGPSIPTEEVVSATPSRHNLEPKGNGKYYFTHVSPNHPRQYYSDKLWHSERILVPPPPSSVLGVWNMMTFNFHLAATLKGHALQLPQLPNIGAKALSVFLLNLSE